MHPELVRLRIPKLSRYLEEQRTAGVWGPKIKELQTSAHFHFPPRMFAEYARRVLEPALDRKVQRVYFPAAYAGTVARAIMDDGFGVLATDLSPHWVEVLKSKGLRADVRSFENLPDKKEFDPEVLVVFEPFPIEGRILGYAAILEILSRRIPYVYITKGIGMNHRKETDDAPFRIRLKDREGVAPWFTLKTAIEYGARGSSHILEGYNNARTLQFFFSTIFPTEAAMNNAKLDLEIIRNTDFWTNKKVVNLIDIALAVGASAQEVVEALERISNAGKNANQEAFDPEYFFEVEIHTHRK